MNKDLNMRAKPPEPPRNHPCIGYWMNTMKIYIENLLVATAVEPNKVQRGGKTASGCTSFYELEGNKN